jgi:hypothetical protein
MEDVYRQKDRFPPDPAVDSLTGDWNPVRTYTTAKRPFVVSAGNWSVLTGFGASATNAGGSLLVEGETYYSYRYVAWESGMPGATLQAEGDLDGDGEPSSKLIVLDRQRGVYVPISEVPGAGEEDATTY